MYYLLAGLVIFYLCSWSAIAHLLLLEKRPAATLSWLLGLLFFPPTLLLYLFIGTDRLRRQRLARLHQPKRENHPPPHEEGSVSSKEDPLAKALENLADFDWSESRNPQLFTQGDLFFEDLLKSIKAARESILMQFYVWRDDPRGRQIRDALTRAAQRGVKVYLLVDELGSVETKSSFFQPLVQAGGHFSWFYTIHPRRNRFFVNLRNHRKISCFDFRTGYIGGMNVGLEYESKDPATGKWIDLHMRTEGPVVRQLASVFTNDWYFATQEEISIPAEASRSDDDHSGDHHPAIVVESGPDQRFARNHLAISALASGASETLDLFTPYFVPTPEILQQIKLASIRGVKVRLMICQTSDIRFLIDIGRSYYHELVEAGVEVYEYPNEVHHAKMARADKEWLMIGSTNLDVRSLQLNFEANMFLRSPALARKIDDHTSDLFARSVRITPESLENLPLTRRYREGFFRLFAPLV